MALEAASCVLDGGNGVVASGVGEGLLSLSEGVQREPTNQLKLHAPVPLLVPKVWRSSAEVLQLVHGRALEEYEYVTSGISVRSLGNHHDAIQERDLRTRA
jgi:hypothetical protein